jgi:hypothetical protein
MRFTTLADADHSPLLFGLLAILAPLRLAASFPCDRDLVLLRVGQVLTRLSCDCRLDQFLG